MKRIALILLLTMPLATPLVAETSRNDDSCDIGLFPAATLLLPYFEVDIEALPGSGETTIFTVTNSTNLAQAARVTLWTDFAYPVISFNLFLTGYDVQSVNLYDVIALGRIEQTGSDVSPQGSRSVADNQRLNESTCEDLVGQMPSSFIQRMRSAFTTGKALSVMPGQTCNTAGGAHQNAVGYATIDVVGLCSPTSPLDPLYFTHELRFDNVLMGDYIQVNGAEDFAQANPMVHIRAIPEGGEVATRRKTNMPRTFYSRLHGSGNATVDGRQPLPSTFSARWIEGGGGGFKTFFKIWRESSATADAACSSYPTAAAIPYDAVRFDEEENPETLSPESTILLPGQLIPRTVSTSLIPSDYDLLPQNTNGALGGWMYFNLHDGTGNTRARQNWVVVSMRAEDRFSVDLDAVSMNNGCTAPSRGIDELTSPQN